MHEIHPSLNHAIRDRLIGDQLLADALAGGLWYREAPARRPNGGYPYGVFSRPSITRQNNEHPAVRETGYIRLAFVSPNFDKARRIAGRAQRLLVGNRFSVDGDGDMLTADHASTTSFTKPGPAGRTDYCVEVLIRYASEALRHVLLSRDHATVPA